MILAPNLLKCPSGMEERNVVSLQAFRELKKAEDSELEYQAKILVMDKLELLEEMVRFQEERSQIGHLTPTLITRGRILFGALETHAATHALRVLARSYRRHLEFEQIEILKSR